MTIRLFALLFLATLLSCGKEEPIEIGCDRSVIIGDWMTAFDRKVYYELQDSTIKKSACYPTTFKENGTGTEAETENFTWTLQCDPNIILKNRINGPLEEDPGEDWQDHTAFPSSSRLKITRITADEIQMEEKYRLDTDSIPRTIHATWIYYREK